MLYTKKAVQDNLRNREGKRVFYLGKGDQLTSDARDFLSRERIAILPAEQAKPERYRLLGGGYVEEKPEHMTHLSADVLVPKNHPRIVFRGEVDKLEAELLFCIGQVPEKIGEKLQEILSLARNLIRCDVLGEPLEEKPLCGFSQGELRLRSHRPQDYYGQPHFMPESTDSREILLLNRVRCQVRSTELSAVNAFITPEGVSRGDIIQALNRMSSMVYILMIEDKAKRGEKSHGY